MSPEISLALDFDRSSDIFSFGITLCETITFKEPSAEFLCRKAQNIFALDEKELADAIVEGCPEELEALACQCCDVDTSKRPTIQTCIEELEALLDAMGGEHFEYNSDSSSKGPNGTLVKDESSLCHSALNMSLNLNLSRYLLHISHHWLDPSPSFPSFLFEIDTHSYTNLFKRYPAMLLRLRMEMTITEAIAVTVTMTVSTKQEAILK